MNYRGGKYHGGILLYAFIIIYRSVGVMYAAQNHSTRKESIALSYRMKMCKAEAVCFHREIVKVFRLCDSKEVRTPLLT